MPTVEVKQVVPAPIGAVYEVVTDMESYPRFMKTIKAIKVLERGEGYTISDWEARLQGARFHWVEKDLFYPNEYRITYDQTSGDLKVFRGYWQLAEVEGGTEVTLVTEFEFGVPMLSSLLNPVAKVAIKDNARSMLDGIAKELQRR
ncbi:type II toxin-antitoxin system RatA family toxin [Sulfobacillus harzensis]|uniref:Cyclase n=1 Tax=Sulfobacillus harzensis TaxID=2729629 RepID=A0A7Y0L3A6_9FIRM|nr:SRPBCC family protein [Sulfobacillus harzensis]NMP22288.1 cyclase [Sulfobacillus harzensis]